MVLALVVVGWMAGSARAMASRSASGDATSSATVARSVRESGDRRHEMGFGGEGRVGASVHHPASTIGLEVHYAWRRFALGVGVEHNAWLGAAVGGVHPGTMHVYATTQHRLWLGRVAIRQRLAGGLAILLDDVLGQPRGALGPFLELGPVGVEFWGARGRAAFVFDPLALAISIPGARTAADGGIPAVFRQYRVTLGVRF